MKKYRIVSMILVILMLTACNNSQGSAVEESISTVNQEVQVEDTNQEEILVEKEETNPQKIAVEKEDTISVEEGTNETEKDMDEDVDYNVELDNTYDQLIIIAENRDMWITDLEYADEVYRYAVTDLDHNGRYEVVVSNMGGTGLYTYSRFFEINETFDGLVECTTDFMEGDSQPDMIVENMDTYLDENGEYHYVLTDVLRNGMAEYYENVRELVLREGQIITQYLVTKSTIFEGEVPTVTCQDYAGNVITEEEYENAADNYFAGYEKVMTKLGWQDVHQLPDNVDSIIVMLEDSYAVYDEK